MRKDLVLKVNVHLRSKNPNIVTQKTNTLPKANTITLDNRRIKLYHMTTLRVLIESRLEMEQRIKQ
jgi:hypothetical protein